jgi:AGZA family xanthine/uracil permease-like MFS transporter
MGTSTATSYIESASGIAFGFISYSMLKLVTGKGRDVHWVIYLFAVLFIVRYLIK